MNNTLIRLYTSLRKGRFLSVIEGIVLRIIKRIIPNNIFLFLYEYDNWYRIFLVKNFLKKFDLMNNKKIINIGGGWGELEKGLKRRDIVIYEPNKDFANRAKKNVDNIIHGWGENLELIKENEYQIAFSIHTLEHVPKNKREIFLKEMARVAQELIFLVFPYEYWAEKLCHDIISYCKRKRKEPSPFTIEHITNGIPAAMEIRNFIEKLEKYNFQMFTTQNYYTDKFLFFVYYSNIPFAKLILLPLISAIAFFMRKKAPHTIIVLIGQKNV